MSSEVILHFDVVILLIPFVVYKHSFETVREKLRVGGQIQLEMPLGTEDKKRERGGKRGENQPEPLWTVSHHDTFSQKKSFARNISCVIWNFRLISIQYNTAQQGTGTDQNVVTLVASVICVSFLTHKGICEWRSSRQVVVVMTSFGRSFNDLSFLIVLFEETYN